MITIGLTGGTGAGKTTALNVLESRGALIIDCDAVYHDLIRNSSEMMNELREEFPQAFEGGSFDRKALGKIVFSDEARLLRLNEITHRYVDSEVSRLLSEHGKNGGKLAAIDAIALCESGLKRYCDTTVAITAPCDIRAERIAKREGISLEYARLRIAAQKPDSYFEENCDHVLVNNFDTQAEFEKTCIAFFDNILGGISK